MGGVGREPRLLRERRVQPREGGVQDRRQLVQLAAGTTGADPLGQVPCGDPLGRGADILDGAQRPAHQAGADHQTDRHHRRPRSRQTPGELSQRDAVPDDRPPDQHDIAGARK